MRREDGLPAIGLAIIARDEEASLPRLLDSVGFSKLRQAELRERREEQGTSDRDGGLWRPEAAVDFCVVCDTGSEDRTVAVARARGARIVRFRWVDDFAAARTASYRALPEGLDFSLWADCDDVIDGAELLRAVAARLPAEVAATIHRYDYAQDPEGNCVCELWRERLVRRGIDGRWHQPVHEVMELPPNSAAMVEEVVWRHRSGEKERDPERNYRILSRAWEGGDRSPRTVAYLGTEALGLGRFSEAEERLREYFEAETGDVGDERAQVAHKLSMAIRQGEDGGARLAESGEAAHLAIQERPDWPDGYLDLAEIALTKGDSEGALRWVEVAERLDPPRTMLITNPVEYRYQPAVMRAQALADLGRFEEAEEAVGRALALAPYVEPAQALAAKVAAQRYRRGIARKLLDLREVLVRHDENEKARRLMECAPYLAERLPEIAVARLHQREMTLHADDPETYASYYRENPNEAPFELQGVPIEKAHEAFHRIGFLRRGLAEQAAAAGRPVAELRVLDLTCNDGWALANLARGGFGIEGRLDGMDLNADAARRAAEREEIRSSRRSRIVCDDLHLAREHFEPGSYDAVVLFETIEHVADPRETLRTCLEMAAKGGRLYVSTPDGAYERGDLPGWARVERKGHLRAVDRATLAGWLCEVGVVEGFEVEQRVQAASVRPSARRGRIAIYGGPAEALPEEAVERGLGGSETAMVKVAEHFARRGWDVRVYSGERDGGLRSDAITTMSEPSGRGQVLYEPWTRWDPGEPADLFVSLRVPEAFDYSITAPRRVLWLHDADYGDRLTEERCGRATDVAVLSEFQRDLLSERSALAGHPGLWVTRNGIETSFFEADLPEKEPIAVYSSSPDRGLELLLTEVWPEVSERVPDAVLYATYAPVYRAFAAERPELRALSERIEAAAERLGDSVDLRGSMGQRDLAELFKRARAWAYPSFWTVGGAPFPEISCISAMEAQAAGCVCVTSDHGALRETVRGGLTAAFGDGGRADEVWRAAFVENLVAALTGAIAPPPEARRWALAQDWSGVAEEWERRLLAPAKRPARPPALSAAAA